jgi:hypothetical protein
MDHWINLLPIFVIAAASVFILVFSDWQKILVSYAILFIAAFSIFVQFWSFSFSLVKLITGLMSLAIIGISIFRSPKQERIKTKAELIFRVITIILMFSIFVFLVYEISNYLSIPLELVLASLLIIGLGFFLLGSSHELYKRFLSIITLFFGFELIFSSNETSLLVNGLLALVMLLVSLMGGFLIENEHEEIAE